MMQPTCYVRASEVVAIIVVAGCLVACQPRQPVALDSTAAYAAILSTPELVRHGRGVALGTQRMSDSGTYEASGALPTSVAQALLRAGIVDEICEQRFTPDTVPKCQSRRAGSEIRVSRLLLVGDTVVDVFVGQGTIQKGPDGAFFLPFATTHRCRVVLLNASWVQRGCEQTMIT